MASDGSTDTRQPTRVTIRPIDCSGACHELDVGCTCSGVWREVDAVVDDDGHVVEAPLLPSGLAVQAAVSSLAGQTKSLSETDESA